MQIIKPKTSKRLRAYAADQKDIGKLSQMAGSGKGICLIIYLLAQLLSNANHNCNAQKPITLNVHHHHHHLQQQQQSQPNHHYNGTSSSSIQQQQHSKQASTSSNHNHLLYQNYSLGLGQRPLDRPSLTLVSKSSSAAEASSSSPLISNDSKDPLQQPQHPLEGAADWFMLGGAEGSFGGDLQTEEGRHVAVHSFSDRAGLSGQSKRRKLQAKLSGNKSSSLEDEQADSSDSNEIYDDAEESGGGSSLAGVQKEPDCASNGRYYCTYKEDYPLKLVTEVTKYYKWPLEKLFRDLHAQIMPKLAQDSTGNLVCDSITRVVRPGWARNTNDRWLVVINTDNYHQYVTEVVCQYGTNSRCNFIPPCYYSSCQQRYNTQKLLVIDPNNPYRGPFLSEFLFPSCCVCYVPSASESFQDKYKPSPATIYQRTMQQESAANLNPPQFRPPGIIDDVAIHLADQSSISSRAVPSSQSSVSVGIQSAGSAGNQAQLGKQNQAPGVGEIRRGGEQYRRSGGGNQDMHQQQQQQVTSSEYGGGGDFPRIALADSLISPKSSRESSPEVRQ